MRSDDPVKTPLQKTIEAIEKGNKEQAIAWAKEIWEEGRPLSDLYGDMAGLLVYQQYMCIDKPVEAVEDTWRFVAKQLWKPFLMQIKDKFDENGNPVNEPCKA